MKLFNKRRSRCCRHPRSEEVRPSRHPHGEEVKPSRHPCSEEVKPGRHPDGEEVKPSRHPDGEEVKPGRHPDGEEVKPNRHPRTEEVRPSRDPHSEKVKPDRHLHGEEVKPDRHPHGEEVKPDRHPRAEEVRPSRDPHSEKVKPDRHLHGEEVKPGAFGGTMSPRAVSLLVQLAFFSICRNHALLTDSPPHSELEMPGDYIIAGLFPLHSLSYTSSLPDLSDCQQGTMNKHGYHLMQAMRFAVSEINNGTKDGSLLPNVTLGYRTYDTCSLRASTLVTFALLEEQYRQDVGQQTGQDSPAIAVIGPDSSSYAFLPATALGAYMLPEISYEASDKMLSNKLLYPAFLRTIPSDKNQVNAMIQLLVRFDWTWIALLGSNNNYGLQGMQSLQEEAANYGICIAYQAVIPTYTDATRPQIQQMVSKIVQTQVTTIVVFSSKTIASFFFMEVIEQNVTGKVWIGTEDWSVATRISSIPGINTIGSVIGISIQSATMPGFKEFEDFSMATSKQYDKKYMVSGDSGLSDVPCVQNTILSKFASIDLSQDMYDITSSFNVYKAVYALAHALHLLLDCDSGKCQKVQTKPWQLLQKLKQVRFLIDNTSMYFDANGDPPTGYDIVTWDWTEGNWSVKIVGEYSPDPPNLTVDISQIYWNTNDHSKTPKSICSPECHPGYAKILRGQHKCCFDCQPCPEATFLNKSDPTICQPCALDEWAPSESAECLSRIIILLQWEEPLSLSLLLLLGLTMLMTLGAMVTFLLHLDTPVVKSAGGRTCLAMLLSLLGAAGSSLCHFGHPSHVSCLFKQSLFNLSITVCLACIAVRSFQIVCIFKLSSKLPRAYDTWSRNDGPQATILLIFVTELFIFLLRIVLDHPEPTRDYDFYNDSIILECSKPLSPWACVELGFMAILCILCFCFSYMGKELPANYNEAKCITFSLMIYIISWISVFTMYSVDRSEYFKALHVMAIQASVLGILSGYFLPKVYIILLKPQMNTTAHFQNCIQMYTMSKE
ncbi:taste receptor type 1 member 1 [Paramormyrops kingsleyae]|uniref:taste receptor type 1 member 1 n=1 Tax=Paramormyrops kingsleyae TaxID=1676925 RepID=UPI003B96B399